MTKAAAKQHEEPALDLGMKDITPAKPEAKNPAAKPAPEKTKPEPKNAMAVHAPSRAAAAKVRSESKSIIEIAKECAMDPRVDAGKMQAILTMAREEQTRIDDRIFQLAKFEVQKAMPPITRDSLNQHTKSKWARLEKISAIADPIIRRNGFSLSYDSADCPIPDHYRITCDVTHTPTGYTKHYFIDVGMDSAGAKGGGTKSLAQGSGSSVTYARRFLKVMIFDINIVGEDFDGSRFTLEPRHIESGDSVGVKVIDARDTETTTTDKVVPTKLSIDQTVKLVELIETSGVGLERFLEKYQIKAVQDLPPKDYEAAVMACNNYASEKKKAKA